MPPYYNYIEKYLISPIATGANPSATYYEYTYSFFVSTPWSVLASSQQFPAEMINQFYGQSINFYKNTYGGNYYLWWGDYNRQRGYKVLYWAYGLYVIYTSTFYRPDNAQYYINLKTNFAISRYSEDNHFETREYYRALFIYDKNISYDIGYTFMSSGNGNGYIQHQFDVINRKGYLLWKTYMCDFYWYNEDKSYYAYTPPIYEYYSYQLIPPYYNYIPAISYTKLQYRYSELG